MKIFRVSQSDNNGYDTFDSFVCYANSEDEARNMRPDIIGGYLDEWNDDNNYGWASSSDLVEVEFIGENPDVKQKEMILSSFNAG